jgi:D-3-phosphoglycerate dehydrogenase
MNDGRDERMLHIAILDDYQHVALDMADWSALGSDVELGLFDQHLSGIDEAAEALADFEVLVCMRERMALPGALIARLPKLRFVVFTGSHSTVIDFAALAERGIPVARTGARASPSAAELTWALLLACARHVPREHAAMRAGGWQTTLGSTLRGKTLGILGLGTLGRLVAGYGKAFGMDVIAWSANLTAAKAEEGGATLVSREEIFRRSDALSIHLKYSARSRGLVGAAEFALMKPTAFLINTSRGPIVDEAALIAALRDRRIRAAGLDVFDQEPLPADHPLRGLDNAVLTPHLGYVTEESYREFYRIAVESILAWRAGNPINLYDPSMRSE